MKKLAIIAAGAAILLIAASASPVEAACPNARVITTNGNGIYTPGNPFGGYVPYAGCPTVVCGGPVSYNIQGTFWALGAGNPAGGLGDDSGANTGSPYYYGPASNWIFYSYYGGVTPAQMGYGPYSHWGYSGTDGCIDNNADQCNVVLLTDDDAVGGSFFALLAQGPNAGLNYDMDVAAGGAINLAPLPTPQVVSTLRTGGGAGVDITLAVPGANPAGSGISLNCSPAQNATVLQGFKLYLQSLSRGSAAPTDRSLTSWTPVAGGATFPVGGSHTESVSCGSDLDVYVCATLVMDSGYEVGQCSSNSTRVECGPTVSDPIEIRPDRPRPDRPDRPVIRQDVPRTRGSNSRGR